MQTTKHAMQRMSQRGITRPIIDLTIEYGEIDRDKRVLNCKTAQRLLNERENEVRALKKILDKGGVTVVIDGDSIITTYNY
jgi:hypothetical protein